MSPPERPEEPSAVFLSGHFSLPAAPRADGYRPISEHLWAKAMILGFPPTQELRMIASAARRLDTAHRMLERVRDGLDRLPPAGSPAGRMTMFEIVGDAELAVIALNRAIEIACRIGGRFRVPVPIPAVVTERRRFIQAMRDHYEHIVEWAVDRYRGSGGSDGLAAAEATFASLPVIVRDRQLTDGATTLSLDADATELLIATRDYLVAAWGELVARAHAEECRRLADPESL